MMLYCRQCGDVTWHRREVNGGIIGAIIGGVSGEKCAKCGRVSDEHEAPGDDFGTATFTARESRYLAFMRDLVARGIVEEEGRPYRAPPLTMRGNLGTIIMRYDRYRR